MNKNMELYQKKFHKSVKDLFRDIEIHRFKSIILLLLFVSLGALAQLNFRLGIFRLTDVPSDNYNYLVMFISILGLFCGSVLADKFENRLPILAFLLLSSGVSSLLIVILEPYLTLASLSPLFMFNGFSICAMFIYSMVLSIEYTTLLDRGRVIVLIMIFGSLLLIPIIVVNYISEIWFIPCFIPILASIYFKRQSIREKQKFRAFIGEDQSIEAIKKDKYAKMKKRIVQDATNPKQSKLKRMFPMLLNGNYMKNMISVFTFCVIGGLILPQGESATILENDLYQSYFLISLLILLCLIILIVFMVGVVFDFWGRKTVLSLYILEVGAITFYSELTTHSDLQYLTLVFPLLISLITLIPLATGELVDPKNYGRGSLFGLFIGISGIGLGIILQISSNILQPEALNPLINFICIISFFFLTYSNEGVSKFELDWPNSLRHLYIIHKSGLLLQEYSFYKEDLATSDLVSGGIIGLTAILKEITRGKDRLRAIDHGDKKILFKWSKKSDVIYVLVTSMELFVLRNKLRLFSEEFEAHYSKNLSKFKGVVQNEWDDTIFMINNHFSRKKKSEKNLPERKKNLR
jgi:MFS family permease